MRTLKTFAASVAFVISMVGAAEMSAPSEGPAALGQISDVVAP